MWYFNFQELISAFIVLFAIIDVTGSLPVFIDLKSKQRVYSSFKAALFSFLILLAFFFIGEGILRLFGVDISSFAIAGAIVLFVIGCEMIFGIEIFKMDGPTNNATLVPIVFPILAGPGSFTALLSLKAEYNSLNILLALILNILIIYIVLRNVDRVQKKLGPAGVYVTRKFFGIILLAISVKLFVSNIASLLGN